MGKAIIKILFISFSLMVIGCSSNHYQKRYFICNDKDLQMKNLLQKMIDLEEMQQVFKIPKQTNQDCFPVIADFVNSEKIVLAKFGKPVKFFKKDDSKQYKAVFWITNLEFSPNHVEVTARYDVTGTFCTVLFKSKECDWEIENVEVFDR